MHEIDSGTINAVAVPPYTDKTALVMMNKLEVMEFLFLAIWIELCSNNSCSIIHVV